VSTEGAGLADEPATGGHRASRIVRIGEAAWLGLVVALLLVAVIGAVPRDGWTPWRLAGASAADAWQATQGRLDGWVTDAQIHAGAILHPRDPVSGGVVAAALVGAAGVAMLTLATRTAGVPISLSALLALVAASAPLLAWQARSPLGAGPCTLASAFVLWRLARIRPRWHVTWDVTPVTVAAVVGSLGLVIGLAITARWLIDAASPRDTLVLLRGDVGVIGIVLVLAGFAARQDASLPRDRIRAACVLLWLGTIPLSPTTRAAVMLPWAWWLVASGLAWTMHARGRRAPRWAGVGLVVWIALHAWQLPWIEARQHVALVRTWTDAIAAHVDGDHPLVNERSARGRLVSAQVTRGAARGAGTRILGGDAVPAAARAGAQPVILGRSEVDRLRWTGVAVEPLPSTVGASLDQVLDALPGGIVVVMGISRDAAARLTPPHWQSLGRVGLRLADAGQARAHALVGVTGARDGALEMAGREQVRLDVLPGDPLGRTGTRAPADVRVESGTSQVRLFLRDRPLVDGLGLALAMFTTRGDLLGWRSGSSADHLTGALLGAGRADAAMVRRALPCLEAPAGMPVDVTSLSGDGALGVTMRTAGDAALRVWRPDGLPGAMLDRVDAPADSVTRDLGRSRSGAASTPRTADAAILRLDPTTPTGVLLRGPVARAEIRGTAAVRVCAAWPTTHVLDVADAPVELPMAPRLDPYIGAGWHDIEPLGPGRFFRWMRGARATLVLPLRVTGPIRFVLDAQAVRAPGAGDVVQLSVNGHALGARPLGPTRGLFEWTVPVDAMRDGPNHVALVTSLALRPADVQPGADGRLLGLLVYGWRLARAAEPRGPVPAPHL